MARWGALRSSVRALREPVAFSVVLTATLAGGAGIFLTFVDMDVWGTTKDNQEYCEGVDYASVVRQTANTWSNLAYIAAGGWTWGRLYQARKLRVAEGQQQQQAHQKTPASGACGVGEVGDGVAKPENQEDGLPSTLGFLLGLSDVLLGIGSGLFHCTMTRWGQQMDVGSMYWVMNASILACLWRWLRVCTPIAPQRLHFLSPGLLALAVANFLMIWYKWQMDLRTVFGVQVGIVVFSEFLLVFVPALCLSLCGPKGHCKRLSGVLCLQLYLATVALVTAGVGFIIREKGTAEYMQIVRHGASESSFCGKGNFWQPHALWHVLTGISLLALHDNQVRPPARLYLAEAPSTAGASDATTVVERVEVV